VSNALDLNMMLCGAALFILLPNLQIPWRIFRCYATEYIWSFLKSASFQHQCRPWCSVIDN
jgi:hypothetical protein